MQLGNGTIGGWPVVAGLVLVLAALVVMGWWLFRRRRRQEMRAELVEQLDRCGRRLGLETVWQTPLFQADVYGIHGEIDDFRIRGEMWDKSSRDFFRLTVHYPHGVQQTFRLLSRRRQGIERMWRLRKVDIDDEDFDGAFHLYTRPEDAERIWGLIAEGVRDELLELGERSDRLKMGNNALFVYVEDAADVQVVQQLIEDAVAVAKTFTNQASGVVSAEERQTQRYELASVDEMAREADDPLTGEFPAGTDDEMVEEAVGTDDQSSSPRRSSVSGPMPEGSVDGDPSDSSSTKAPASSSSSSSGSEPDSSDEDEASR